jgi:hypothetical protein
MEVCTYILVRSVNLIEMFLNEADRPAKYTLNLSWNLLELKPQIYPW